jgi:glycosyltransferase involved in cell wall biosynthesis
MILPISVTILYKNSPKYLTQVLDSLKQFDEVVIYENGPETGLKDLVKGYSNVAIHRGKFLGFGKTHNSASSLAKWDWILSVDSDEILTKELVQEIAELSLEENSVYTISRHNFYEGKWIRCCSWYPDRVSRLYNRKKTLFSHDDVHEGIITCACFVKDLKAPMLHYSYSSTADFLSKMQHYSDLFAKQSHEKNKKATLFTAICHGFFAFFKSYILKKGFLGGSQGFIISVYNANTAFYKYLKLRDLS